MTSKIAFGIFIVAAFFALFAIADFISVAIEAQASLIGQINA